MEQGGRERDPQPCAIPAAGSREIEVREQGGIRSPRGSARQLAFDLEDLHQQRNAHPHAVALLAPVHRPRIAIDHGIELGARAAGDA